MLCLPYIIYPTLIHRVWILPSPTRTYSCTVHSPLFRIEYRELFWLCTRLGIPLTRVMLPILEYTAIRRYIYPTVFTHYIQQEFTLYVSSISLTQAHPDKTDKHCCLYNPRIPYWPASHRRGFEYLVHLQQHPGLPERYREPAASPLLSHTTASPSLQHFPERNANVLRDPFSVDTCVGPGHFAVTKEKPHRGKSLEGGTKQCQKMYKTRNRKQEIWVDMTVADQSVSFFFSLPPSPLPPFPRVRIRVNQ